jgi:putative membrane protein
MLSEAQISINSLNKILEVSIQGSELNADLSNTLVEDLIYFKDSISLLNNFLNKFDDNQIRTIISVLQTDPAIMADNLTNPFEIEEQVIYPLDNYGSGMTPIYSSLAMWVGAVILTSIFSSELKDFTEFKDYSVKEKYLGKFILFGVMACIQGLVLMIGNKFMLGVQVSNMFVFIVLGTYCSLIFSLIVYTNVSLFGDFGKALNVILLVLQIAGTGGAYPIQLCPPFFRAIAPFLPFTYSLGIIRESINGVLVTAVLYDVLILTIIGLVYLFIGYNYKEKIYIKTLKFNKKFEESKIGE